MGMPKKPSTLASWGFTTALSALMVYWLMVELQANIALNFLFTGGVFALAFYLMYINYD
jgi:hypothetical protein